MPKFYGNIGYAISKETAPGVWVEDIVEHQYSGDVYRNTRKLQSGNQVNDSIDISNEISILSDPFANENFHSMRYVTYMGAKWKVSSVEVRYPRLILTVGGLYNGQTRAP